MYYLEKNTHDKNYPYTISDAWGGKCYMTEEGLKILQKEIEKALDKKGEKLAVSAEFVNVGRLEDGRGLYGYIIHIGGEAEKLLINS